MRPPAATRRAATPPIGLTQDAYHYSIGAWYGRGAPAAAVADANGLPPSAPMLQYTDTAAAKLRPQNTRRRPRTATAACSACFGCCKLPAVASEDGQTVWRRGHGCGRIEGLASPRHLTCGGRTLYLHLACDVPNDSACALAMSNVRMSLRRLASHAHQMLRSRNSRRPKHRSSALLAAVTGQICSKRRCNVPEEVR